MPVKAELQTPEPPKGGTPNGARPSRLKAGLQTPNRLKAGLRTGSQDRLKHKQFRQVFLKRSGQNFSNHTRRLFVGQCQLAPRPTINQLGVIQSE